MSQAVRTGTSPGSGSIPARSGKGSASALVRPGIEAASAAGLPTVLLTNNEANLPFYESQGFVVVREGRTPEDGPRAWAMVRRP